MKQTAPNIVLTGGGTAGHVTPHLAILPHLQKDGWQVSYIGSREGIEKGMLSGIPGLTYHAISTGKLRRYFDIKNLSDPFRVIAGFFQSLRLLRRIRPDIVFSKGGFVAVPVVVAAFVLRIPVLAHESDLTPGLANRISQRFAKKVAATFPECAQALGKKGVHTGTPMRRALFEGERQQGLALAGFSGQKPVLLMMGGSQGAKSVNLCLRQALPQILPGLDVLHLCGKGNLDMALNNTPGYFQTEFLSDALPDALAASDLVLSRAGATAIGEFLALKKPMLLVPLPLSASRGDQIQNAKNYQARGLAKILPQEDMNPDSLATAINQLQQAAPSMQKAMENETLADGTQAVLDLIRDVSGRR